MLLFCLLLHAEQVSARIVQEVTAEAVAVLKGEQESLADTAKRLPSGGFVTQEGERAHTLGLLVKDVVKYTYMLSNTQTHRYKRNRQR